MRKNAPAWGLVPTTSNDESRLNRFADGS
jgi:hypothetical protein